MKNLRIYLESDKFHEDTTVQVADVLRRLVEAQPRIEGTVIRNELVDIMNSSGSFEYLEGALIGMVTGVMACGVDFRDAVAIVKKAADQLGYAAICQRHMVKWQKVWKEV